jgi:hypothetical protein
MSDKADYAFLSLKTNARLHRPRRIGAVVPAVLTPSSMPSAASTDRTKPSSDRVAARRAGNAMAGGPLTLVTSV